MFLALQSNVLGFKKVEQKVYLYLPCIKKYQNFKNLMNWKFLKIKQIIFKCTRYTLIFFLPIFYI